MITFALELAAEKQVSGFTHGWTEQLTFRLIFVYSIRKWE